MGDSREERNTLLQRICGFLDNRNSFIVVILFRSVFFGRCQPCPCDPMGSVNGSCHPDSGVCSCKLLVAGDQCDGCQVGATHFDPGNHLGCSKGAQIHVFTSSLLPFPAFMLKCPVSICSTLPATSTSRSCC